MNFMSTRIVYQLDSIFEEMKEARTVKQAQEKLRVLSLREDFELALSTFLARCNDKDQILLSLVLLQKQPKITNIQTIWTLKPLYYHSHPKISQLTSTIITTPQNIHHAFQFLKSNLHNINLSEFIKYIDLLYDLLQRVDNLSGENVQQLGRCFEECFSVINSHEELYLMALVCLFMFYRKMINRNNNQQFHQHWNTLILPKLQAHNETNSNECYHHLCQNMIQTELLQEMLSALANSTPLKYTTNQFKILLSELFKCWQSSNCKRYKYLIVILEGLFQLQLMVMGEGVMVQFLESVRGWNQMSNLNKRSSYEVYGDYQIDHSDIPSQRLTNITDHCINTLFNLHQTWLSTTYLPSLTQEQALQQITILLNMYTSHSPMATQIIRSTMQEIGKYLQQVIESNSINEEGQLDRIMNYVEFLAKYSESLDLEGLVEICGWLSQVAMVRIQVCGLCYGLMEDVWERFTFLDCNGLLCFLEQHLKTLNTNVWGMTMNNYQCALHLSLYLQHTYSFISTPNNIHHPTYIQILKAYKTIIQLFKQTKEEKINIEIVKSVIKLLVYLIKSGNVGLQGEEDEYSVWFVEEKMVNFGVLSYEGAIVMGVCRMKKGILQGEVDRELVELELDGHDYEYYIKLYIELIKNTSHLSQINYINNHHHLQPLTSTSSYKQYPTSPQQLFEVLLSKILQFLKQIQLQKEVTSNLKQSIIWQQLKTTINFYNNNTNPSKILHLMTDIIQILTQ